jgi:hypothetical protein
MKTLDHNIGFKFRNLEITSSALVLYFFDEKTVILLAEIKSYQMRWYLHDPIFGKKWWFLVLTVVLENGHEESAPVTFVKFNYLDDEIESRRQIERELADALDLALAKAAGSTQKMICL